VFITLLALPQGALADPSITFIAPPGARSYADQALGPVGYAEAPTAIRTTDRRPLILIRGNAGTQLQCHFDNIQVDPQVCGGPSPGCPAAVCGSFQPATPLGPDTGEFTRSHFLAVDLVDSEQNVLASTWINIDVDTSPPVTSVDSEHGVLTLAGQRPQPLRPRFGYEVTDQNSVGGFVDTTSCSWAPVSAPPAFHRCAAHQGTGSISPGLLARRHRLYRLEVRGTDDFGRSTVASGVYDPIPCVLSLARPGGIGKLVSSGIQTRLSCDTLRQVTVAVYAFMVNGKRFSTPQGAVEQNPILGLYKVSSRSGPIKITRRLRLFGAARTAIRHARSLGLVFAAGDSDKILAGIADASLAYKVLTLRH
jgi:hypothetical protein